MVSIPDSKTFNKECLFCASIGLTPTVTIATVPTLRDANLVHIVTHYEEQIELHWKQAQTQQK